MKRKSIFWLLGCIISLSVVGGCHKAVFNNPESIATFVIESLLYQDYDNLKKYATDELSRIIDSTSAKSIFEQADMLKNMYIENIYVTEDSEDGTIKNVNFIMRNGNRKSNVCVTMVDENGKWLYSKIQYK